MNSPSNPPPNAPSNASPPSAPPRAGVRFAPSPTGRLHIGNLRTAWISREWARALGTPWVVRVEDIDLPRVLPGAQGGQLADMASLGLLPDRVLIQSESHGEHHRLFARAVRDGRVYACDCSRKDVRGALAGFASAPHGESPVYSGRCRRRGRGAEPLSVDAESWAWRFRMPDASGRQDFIVARSRPCPAEACPPPDAFSPSYHWACAVDDHLGRYRLLVRAWDLESSAAPQRAIQAWLCGLEGRSAEFPALFHTSLVTGADGGRLEKRARGVTLPELNRAGVTNERILAAFRRGFDPARFTAALFLDSDRSGPIGEPARSLRVSDLRLEP